MRPLAQLGRRLLCLFRRTQFDRDLEEEMRFHLEMRSRELGPAAARRRFGSPTLLLEDSRAAWRWRWLDALASDLRFALRMMRRNPAFSAVAVLTLGLAIGANTLVFSLVDAVLLRPLPYAEPDRLYFLWTVEAPSQRGMNTSYPDFRNWQQQSRVFASMSAYAQSSFNLTGAGDPERVDALHFTPGLLELLGIQPALGRPFRDDDGANVALLGHTLWTRHFGADPSVIGRSVRLDGKFYTVVGVCPRGFHFPPNRFSGDPELFVPLVPNPDRTAWFLRVIARLAPSATAAQARQEMNAIAARLAGTHPVDRRAPAVLLDPVLDYVVADSRQTALVLLGAVAFVLLIACANIANLLLSQGAARRREIAIRAAIGASRLRLVRQLLVESALLAACGAAAGVALARAGFPMLAAVAPERTAFFTRIRDAGVQLNPAVLAFTAAISLLASLLFGVLPALKVTRPAEALPRRARSGRLRGALIGVEVCLALVLLTGAGLMIRSMLRLLAVDLGFRADRLLTLEINRPRARSASAADEASFFQMLLWRLETLPGVVSAAGASDLPLTLNLSTGQIRIEVVPPVMGRAVYHVITPGYFETMGIPMLRGRSFSAADTVAAPPVAIVNRALADRYWPNDDPVGKLVSVFGVRSVEPLTVVGVVADVRLLGRDAPPRPEIFRPHAQRGALGLAIVLRTAAVPESLAPAVRREIWRIDPDQPINDLQPMRAILAMDVASRRFVLLLIGAFAAVALLLAAIGIFGVVSYAVRQRTAEIGIRMALGARRRNVAALVLRETALWVFAGIALGLAGSVAQTRLLSVYLYDVKPIDAPTFALASLALAAIAALANLVPARRAVQIDPVVALRYE